MILALLLGCPSVLPPDRTVLLEHPWGYDLVADPSQRDAVSAYGACLGTIEVCVETGGGDLDACTRNVKTKKDPQTEPACPSACVKAYQSRADSGTPPAEAFLAVFVDDTSCFPNLPVRP